MDQPTHSEKDHTPIELWLDFLEAELGKALDLLEASLHNDRSRKEILEFLHSHGRVLHISATYLDTLP